VGALLRLVVVVFRKEIVVAGGVVSNNGVDLGSAPAADVWRRLSGIALD